MIRVVIGVVIRTMIKIRDKDRAVAGGVTLLAYYKREGNYNNHDLCMNLWSVNVR